MWISFDGDCITAFCSVWVGHVDDNTTHYYVLVGSCKINSEHVENRYEKKWK